MALKISKIINVEKPGETKQKNTHNNSFQLRWMKINYCFVYCTNIQTNSRIASTQNNHHHHHHQCDYYYCLSIHISTKKKTYWKIQSMSSETSFQHYRNKNNNHHCRELFVILIDQSRNGKCHNNVFITRQFNKITTKKNIL